MSRSTRFWFPLLVVILIVSVHLGKECFSSVMGGGSSARQGYIGSAGPIEIRIEFDEDLALLAAAKTKYLVIPIRVANEGTTPVQLGADDRIEMVLEGGDQNTLVGGFDLKAVDPDLHRSLSQDRRDRLAYPEQLEGARPATAEGQPRPSHVLFFAFFKMDQPLPRVPRVLRYHIKSADQTIEIRNRGPAAS